MKISKILKMSLAFEKLASDDKSVFEKLEEGINPDELSDEEIQQMFEEMGGTAPAASLPKQEDGDLDQLFLEAMQAAEKALGFNLGKFMESEPDFMKFTGTLFHTDLKKLLELDNDKQTAFQDFVYGRYLNEPLENKKQIAEILRDRDLTKAQDLFLFKPLMDAIQDD